MANTLKQAVRDLFKEAKKSRSSMQRILKPSSDGAGSRVFPPQQQKKDEQFGIRIDKGEAVSGKVRLNLQINSNAAKKTLKDLAKKNGSHKKYVTVEVDPNQEVSEANIDRLEEEFIRGVDAGNAI
ncbi:hypothetical protein PMIN06_012935 [Paraphaeosphaeria minitans]